MKIVKLGGGASLSKINIAVYEERAAGGYISSGDSHQALNSETVKFYN